MQRRFVFFLKVKRRSMQTNIFTIKFRKFSPVKHLKMELNCTFAKSENFGYFCKVIDAVIKLPETQIIRVRGKHSFKMCYKDVTKVEISNQTVEYFPRGLGQLFPNITMLQIYNCGLKMISREDLIGLESLQDLDLRDNQLTSLPDDLFIDMYELKGVLFEDNKLEVMSSKLLESVKDGLEYADFENNTNIDARFILGNRNASLEQLMEIIDANCHKPAEKPKVKIQVTAKSTPVDAPPAASSTSAEFMDGIKALWETRRFADFTIVSGKKHFKVHKNVIGMQSSVFATIFENDVIKMEIENFNATAVEDFLRFFYTLEIQEEIHAMEIFALASKYNVSKMKAAAVKIILRHVNNENATEVLNLGNLYGSEELKNKAFEEIEKMFPGVTLPVKIKDKPEDVEELIEKKRNFKRKIQDVEEEQKQKVKEAEEEGKVNKKSLKEEYEFMFKSMMKKYKMKEWIFVGNRGNRDKKHEKQK